MSTHKTNELESKDVGQVTGLINEVLTPVEAPAAVKRRLRDEIIEVARLKTDQAVRLEPDKRTSTWAIGAAVGTVVALASGVWWVLRNRMSNGPDTPRRGTQD